jgi:hypothetical protein
MIPAWRMEKKLSCFPTPDESRSKWFIANDPLKRMAPDEPQNMAPPTACDARHSSTNETLTCAFTLIVPGANVGSLLSPPAPDTERCWATALKTGCRPCHSL